MQYSRLMSTLKKEILNLTLQKAVPGTVLTMRWLAEQGVSKDLARKYVASGWLERLGRGAYQRKGDTVGWKGAVFSLQTQLNLNVHVAALSTLQLKGQSHFLAVGHDARVVLFSDGSERLPAWFVKNSWDALVEHHGVRLFDHQEQPLLSDIQCQGFSIRSSTPECAAFEVLYLVHKNDDFDYALTLFEGFTNFRPAEVQKLLEACCSVRVKRIFLWMARACSHPWLKYIDQQNVNLGSGKRVVYDGGMLDRELLITVPRKEYVEVDIGV